MEVMVENVTSPAAVFGLVTSQLGNVTSGPDDGGGGAAELLEWLEMVEHAVNVTVGIAGVLGAAIVVLVYKYKHNTTPSETIITALSLVDMLYNVLNNVCRVLMQPTSQFRHSPLVRGLNYGSFSFTLMSSFLLISLISVNRWFAICRPLSYKSTFSGNRVYAAIAAILVLSVCQFALNLVFPFVQHRPALVNFINHEFYVVLNLQVIGATAIMIAVYLQVLRTLREQSRRLDKKPADTRLSTCSQPPAGSNRSSVVQKNGNAPNPADKPSRDARNRNKVTLTLFIICVVFMACVSPFLIYEDAVYYLELDPTRLWARVLRKVTRIIFLLNFVANPVIYFTTSTIFRERLGVLVEELLPLRCVRRRQRGRGDPTRTTSMRDATTRPVMSMYTTAAATPATADV